MSRFRLLSVLSAFFAVSMSFIAPAVAAPVAPAPASPVDPQATPADITFQFSVPPHWQLFASQEQDGITALTFLLDDKGSKAFVIYGEFGYTADELVSKNVAQAVAAGFVTIRTEKSPDKTLVSVRMQRVHKDSGVIEDAVVAARMSPDAPKAGILIIGRWGKANGDTNTSQALDALRKTKIVKK